MKIHGKPLAGPNHEIVVLPRPPIIEEENEVPNDIIFECAAVIDFDEFDKLCPLPSPPKTLKRGETVPVSNIQDPSYLKKIEEYTLLQTDYLFVKSINATPGLSWEKVDLKNPQTWKNWRSELKDSGLTISEITKVQQAVLDANGMDDSKIEEARNRFLARRRQAVV